MKVIRANAVGIATETFGTPGGEAIVSVMGATASMVWWPKAMCEGLASAGYQVIRYDNRDTGQTTTGLPGRIDYGVHDLAEDMLAVLDGYGLTEAHVVGMSLGGYIAQLAALKYPERITSLTLIASEPLGWSGAPLPGTDEKFMQQFAGLATLNWNDRQVVASFMTEIARLSTGSGHIFDAQAAQQRVNAELDRAIDIQSAFNHAMIGGVGDERWQAADISQPVLVIHGSEDPIIPLANGEALAKTI